MNQLLFLYDARGWSFKAFLQSWVYGDF